MVSWGSAGAALKQLEWPIFPISATKMTKRPHKIGTGQDAIPSRAGSLHRKSDEKTLVAVRERRLLLSITALVLL